MFVNIEGVYRDLTNGTCDDRKAAFSDAVIVLVWNESYRLLSCCFIRSKV